MLEVNINFSKKHLNILNEEMIAQRIERFLKDKDTEFESNKNIDFCNFSLCPSSYLNFLQSYDSSLKHVSLNLFQEQ